MKRNPRTLNNKSNVSIDLNPKRLADRLLNVLGTLKR